MIRNSILVSIICIALLTACDGVQDVSYAPDAYGEHGHCYYVDDPAEVQYLYNDRHCPRSWTPMAMPVYWHAMYYLYYDSPSYYNAYIPVRRRMYYRTTVVRRFETTHRTEITQYSKKTQTRVKSKQTTKSQSKTTTQRRATTQSKTTMIRTTSSFRSNGMRAR